MTPAGLEVTITHNFGGSDPVEHERLLVEKNWIALDWGRKGPNPDDYDSEKARSQVGLFHRLSTEGGAVLAAYNRVLRRGERVVGFVKAGTPFEFLRPVPGKDHGLLCLPLTHPQRFDSSSNFLGNLPPRQCSVQPCGNRAQGRLWALAHGESRLRSVDGLHHKDLEWLVSNYLVRNGVCAVLWSGGQSFADIDHIGITAEGGRILAQTTRSLTLVKKKTATLEPHRDAGKLLFFAPEAARTQVPSSVTFVAIEEVFAWAESNAAGAAMLDAMLGDGLAGGPPPQP